VDKPATKRDYTAEIIENTEAWYSTRNSVAFDYAWGIRYHESEIDWPRVNAAIIERWSKSALAYIKRRAWKVLRDDPDSMVVA